ncbi:hypothetical protein CRUP_034894 [Coryphaenoides rupestris]|nr:hypothetical protein CRUP_034894 [Coryphaenoides rupestris]
MARKQGLEKPDLGALSGEQQEKLRQFKEAHVCMMRSFLAPISWNILMGGGDMTPEDYDSMMWAAEPLLQDMSPSDMSLPRTVDLPKMKRM